MGRASAPGGHQRDFILGLQGPGPWVAAVQAAGAEAAVAAAAASFPSHFQDQGQPMADLWIDSPN